MTWMLVGVLGFAQPASAGLVRGVAYLAAGVIEVPRATLTGAVRQFPIGIVTGALGGTLRGLGYLTRGVFEIVGAAIPIAKSVAPFIPIFL